MANVLSFEGLDGNRHYVAPENQREISLFEKMQYYNESTRRKLLELESMIPKYEARAMDVPENYPTEYDDTFMALMDLV
jgi:hypothetical protein